MKQPNFIDIEIAAHSGAFGHNSLPEPTQAQAIAGNYKVGRMRLHGLGVAIEQPRGSYRTGIEKSTGKRWVSRMAAHYGYISGTMGNDGDPVDCFIGFYPQSQDAFVVNQSIDGKFDEHKVFLCFPDQESARMAYLGSYELGWNGLESIIALSASQLKWWLKNGDMKKPIRAENLPNQGLETMTLKVQWNSDGTPYGATIDQVLYEIRRSDAGEGLLFDSITQAEIVEDSEGVLFLDALVTPFAKLERKMEVLNRVMETAGKNVKPVAMQITEPFKQRGVANVAAIFELSDGQTVSAYFHNPDTTPGKMAPTDEVISWKWLLNKKDITIVAAPERGVDLNVREVARRIMALAEKNSATFQRVNAKRSERMQAIQTLKDEITTLEKELQSVQTELEAARLEAEEREAMKQQPASQEPSEGTDLSMVAEGDRIRFTPNAESQKEGIGVIEGTLTAKQDTSGGDYRLTIAIDQDAPQGGGKIRRTVYGRQGSVEVIPDAAQGGDDNEIENEQQQASEGQAGGQASLEPEGRENIVKTAKGTKVKTGFTVVELDRLIASHDANGNPNPDFPQELQPRDRARETSQAWVLKTARNLDPDSLGRTQRADSGAPIVGPDGVVESGNGRTMAIKEAYRLGSADEYRAWLIQEADYFGIDPEKVAGMKQPALVRVRTSEVDRAVFAVEANQDDKLAMTATEKARSDANRLTDDMIAKMADDGELLAASNRDFLGAFLQSLGDTEAAQYMTSNGQPTASLIARVQAAIFSKAYNDDRLLELTADSAKPEIANIIAALNVAAPEFIKAQAADKAATEDAVSKMVDSVELSLNAQAVNAIIGATEMLKRAKDSGMSIEDFVRQGDMFGEIDPAVASVALFIHKNNRSAKRMGIAFRAMAEFVRGEIEKRKNADLFGGDQEIEFTDIVAAANRKLDQEFGEGAFAIEQTDLFAPKPPENEPAVLDEPTEFDHSGFRVYKTRIRVGGQDRELWAVQSIENKEKADRGEREGGGDQLFDQKDKAIAHAESQAETVARTAARRIEQEAEAKKAAEQAMELNDEYADIGGPDGESPVQRGRRVSALSQQIKDSDGEILTIKRFIEKRIAAGWVPVVEQENKYKELSRAQFFRMNQQEQDAHAKKVASGGKVSVYFLEKDDAQTKINKIGYDYATYIVSKAAGAEGVGQQAVSNTSTQEQTVNETKAIEMELQKLANGEVTDTGLFDQMLDGLADRAEKAGAMEELDGLLNSAADKLTELLEKEAANA